MKIVTDASVLAKWFLPTEDLGVEALLIRTDFQHARISLAAPALLDYEMANIFSIAVKRTRLPENRARELFQEFINLKILTYELPQLHTLSLTLAINENITTYDASYLALAIWEKIDFFTADQKLLRGVGKIYPFAKHLSEYQPVT